jgi:hypothetical protein
MADQLDRDIRRLMRAVAESSPQPPPFPADQIGRLGPDLQIDSGVGDIGTSPRSQAGLEGPSHRSGVRVRGPVVAVGVFALVLAVGLGVILVGGGRGGDVAESGLQVEHLVFEYSQQAELVCEGGTAAKTGSFDTMRLEVWADRGAQRWRQQVTYPDGSTRDLVAVGTPWSPDRSFSQGKLSGGEAKCVFGPDELPYTLMAEPGQGPGVFSLDPLDQVPLITDGGPEDGSPQVVGYRELGTLVPGDHVDSQGRPGDLYRQRIEGFTKVEGKEHPLVQVTEWLVDPVTGGVLEVTFEETSEPIGTVHTQATRIGSNMVTVDESSFDTDGYVLIWDAASTTTTTLAAQAGRVTVFFRPGDLTDNEWQLFRVTIDTIEPGITFETTDETTARTQAETYLEDDPDTLATLEAAPEIVTGYAQLQLTNPTNVSRLTEAVDELDFVMVAYSRYGPRLGSGHGAVQLTFPQEEVRGRLWQYLAGPMSSPCAVTIPDKSGFEPPAPYPSTPSPDGAVWYGTAELWTVLRSDGIYVPRKSVWWSSSFAGGQQEATPDISVTYERLDQSAPLITMGSPGTNAYTPQDGSFMIAGIDPQTSGCWKVTATYRDTTLSYIYQVP